MASVTVKSIGGMTHLVAGERHAIVADEPPDAGGSGLGMDPFELLLASVGS